MACQTIAGACPELLDSTERRMGKVPVEGGGIWGCLSEALPEGESVNREGQLTMIGCRALEST